MKYRLFLSDFDGTLVRADGTVSEGNRRAIAQYTQAGGIFAVCTGRALSSILPRVRELGLCGLVAAFQGATIADIRSGALIKNACFPRGAADGILRRLENEKMHIHVYTVDAFYCNVDDVYLHEYEAVCGIRARIQPHLADHLARSGEDVVKILVMVPPQSRIAVQTRLQEALGDDYFVTCSAEFLVEIMPKDQNKGAAVRALSAHFGIPRGETAAIGDQLNDLPMLEAAGGKFAVENAQPQLKAIASVVASNEEDGVAEAITRYAMEG